LKILKEVADLIGPILCDIIDHSFCSKEFPANWKIYDICPIPKIIPPPSVEDLRPIALTNIFSKIQQSFAVEWMTQDVLPNVTPSQYGGLAGSSTTLALLNLLHNWYQALDQPHTKIRVLFLDFTKAFDLINHNKLLHDMQRMGVREALIPWIASYLKGRKQMTKVGNVKSELKQVNGGVPQGSKIGPLAFIIKINGLEEVCKGISNIEKDTVILYMDDSILSEILSTASHVSGEQIGKMQLRLDAVVNWSNSQDMV
jgi:hypothetical protein